MLIRAWLFDDVVRPPQHRLGIVKPRAFAVLRLMNRSNLLPLASRPSESGPRVSRGVGTHPRDWDRKR